MIMGAIFPIIATSLAIGDRIAGTVLQGTSNARNRQLTADRNAAMLKIASDNNELQERLNAANNRFAHNEAILAAQRQQDFQDRLNEYNSPIEMVQRFQDAGINPVVAMGNGTQSASSVPSMPAASPHGSGITPSMPDLAVAQDVPPMTGIQSLVSASADMLNAISDNRIKDAHAKEILTLLNESLEGLKKDNQLKAIATFYQPVMNEANIGANLASAFNSYSSGLDALASRDEKKALEKLHEVEEQFKAAETKVSKEQYNTLKFANEHALEEFKARLENMRAGTRNLNASAGLASAQKVTEDSLREVRAKVLGADYEKTASEAEQQKAINKINDVLDKHGLRIKYQFGHYAVEGEKAAFELNKWKRIYRNPDLLDIAVKAFEMELRKENPADWFTVLDRVESALGSGLTAGAILAK